MSKSNDQLLVDIFWDTYQETGIAEAILLIQDKSESKDLAALETAIPYLVEEARNRDIDVVKFLEELDNVLEKQDASRTNNDGGELPSDSSDQADESQDEDESAPARDADAEDRDTEQGS